MEARVPARLTAAEGRKFAFPVGGVFGVLAALQAWRGRPNVALACGVLAAALLVAGLVAPQRLGPLLRAWSAFGERLSKVTTPVFLGVIYFVVLTPVGVLMRLFGRRPLERPVGAPSWWIPRTPHARHGGDMERQF